MLIELVFSLLLSSCVIHSAPVLSDQAPIRAKRAFDLSCKGCMDLDLYEEAFENGNAVRFNKLDQLLQERRRMRKFFDDVFDD